MDEIQVNGFAMFFIKKRNKAPMNLGLSSDPGHRHIILLLLLVLPLPTIHYHVAISHKQLNHVNNLYEN